MFYNNIKNIFDRMDALKRPFARNIALALMFCLLAVASVNLKTQNSLSSLLLLLTLGTLLANLLFIYLIGRTEYAYLYYLLIAIGGLCALSVLFIGAFELIGWDNNSQFVFWVLFSASSIVLIYIHYITLDKNFLKRYIVSEKSKYAWNIEEDIYANANKRYSVLTNLIRYIVAPFAPAVGMMLSRNLQGDQEWLILGLMMLLLSLILSAGYLKFFALGFRLLYWQKTLLSEIKIQ